MSTGELESDGPERCSGTDQPVPPTCVAASETSPKTCVASGSAGGAGVASITSVALSMPNGVLHFEHRRESGGLVVWQDGHSTIINGLGGWVYFHGNAEPEVRQYLQVLAASKKL